MKPRAPRMQARMLASLAVLTLLAGVLIGRLGQLQLTDHPAGADGASGPGTSRVTLPALRGRILDREGRPLVDNAVRTDVTIDRRALADADDGGRATVRRLAQALDLPFDRMWGRTALCGAPGAADPPDCWAGSALVPVPLAVDVDPQAAATLTERPELYPGVTVTNQPVRAYPRAAGGGAPQTTGYLTRSEGDDGGLVGAAGLELQYDELLRGTPGHSDVRVDARGVPVEETDREEPVAGSDLVTTLDLDVQRTTERALADGVADARDRGHRADTAAAVVLDLRDGGVVASASVPTYDPSVWSQGVTQTQYDRLTSGEGSPLIDRVTGVAQPPASTFKAVTLPGAVAAGTDLDDEVNCSSSYRTGGRTFNNFESRAYGMISWREAIKVSCDTVFYRVADRVWRDQGGLSGDDAGDPQHGVGGPHRVHRVGGAGPLRLRVDRRDALGNRCDAAVADLLVVREAPAPGAVDRLEVELPGPSLAGGGEGVHLPAALLEVGEECLLDHALLDERSQPHMAVAGIVVDDRQVLRARIDQGVDQFDRCAGTAEAADHDGRAVTDTGDRFARGGDCLVHVADPSNVASAVVIGGIDSQDKEICAHIDICSITAPACAHGEQHRHNRLLCKGIARSGVFWRRASAPDDRRRGRSDGARSRDGAAVPADAAQVRLRRV